MKEKHKLASYLTDAEVQKRMLYLTTKVKVTTLVGEAEIKAIKLGPNLLNQKEFQSVLALVIAGKVKGTKLQSMKIDVILNNERKLICPSCIIELKLGVTKFP